MFAHRSGAFRAALAGLAVVLLATAGCTGGGERSPSGEDEPGLPERSVGSSATLEPRPVTIDVAVARTAGTPLRRAAEQTLERQVARLVSRYFDAAFLAGPYPRESFPGAFADFTPGAARTARDDLDLLTNAASGARTEQVVPVRKQVRLDVLVPTRTAAAVTARITLVFVAERSDGADERVTVTGRLLLNRATPAGWQVFGYDISRSSTAPAKGATR